MMDYILFSALWAEYKFEYIFLIERLALEDDICGHFDLSLGANNTLESVMVACDPLLGLKVCLAFHSDWVLGRPSFGMCIYRFYMSLYLLSTAI